MKKSIPCLLGLVICLVLAGCGNADNRPTETTSTHSPQLLGATQNISANPETNDASTPEIVDTPGPDAKGNTGKVVFTMKDLEVELPAAMKQTVFDDPLNASDGNKIRVNEWECTTDGNISYLVIQYRLDGEKTEASIGQACDEYFGNKYSSRFVIVEGQGNDLLTENKTKLGELNEFKGSLSPNDGLLCELGYVME